MAPSLRHELQERRREAEMNPTFDPARHSEGGAINISSAITVAGVIVGAVVGLSVLAALAPTWFDSVGDLGENFSTADVGDTTANDIANNVFPLIIGLLGVFAIAGLAFAAMKLRK
jgi:hypothetical protein